MKVRYFARYRELAGTDEDIFSVSPKSTVADVVKLICDKHSSFEKEKNFMFALNETFVEPESVVSDQDTLAVFPPVSGG